MMSDVLLQTEQIISSRFPTEESYRERIFRRRSPPNTWVLCSRFLHSPPRAETIRFILLTLSLLVVSSYFQNHEPQSCRYLLHDLLGHRVERAG